VGLKFSSQQSGSIFLWKEFKTCLKLPNYY
jgi:hypothetical protein